MKRAVNTRLGTKHQRHFLRCSPKTQSKGAGIQRQRKAIKTALSTRDTLYRVYTDRGCAGTTLKRPALQRLLRDARRCRSQGVRVEYLDRLSRNIRDIVHLIDEFRRCGVALKTATGHIDTSSPQGRFQAMLIASMIDYERRMKGKRIKIGRRRLK